MKMVMAMMAVQEPQPQQDHDGTTHRFKVPMGSREFKLVRIGHTPEGQLGQYQTNEHGASGMGDGG